MQKTVLHSAEKQITGSIGYAYFKPQMVIFKYLRARYHGHEKEGGCHAPENAFGGAEGALRYKSI